MNYSYKQTYELMRKFYNLGVNEVRIMDYLMDKDVVKVSYSELTENLGMDKKLVSNIRKAVLHLQKLGLICVVNRYLEDENKTYTNPMIACFIVDGWLDNLLNNKELDG